MDKAAFPWPDGTVDAQAALVRGSCVVHVSEQRGTPDMTLRTLILRYAAFAAIATLANLATQRLVLFGGTSAERFALALGAGTAVGLVVKYVLDKRWIFGDTESDLKAHGRKFTLYTLMGLVTTAIFWGSEILFWMIWRTTAMRELGALLGLSIGYVVKYYLDRRFVFNRPGPGLAA
jgi:putative flippase GtrA